MAARRFVKPLLFVGIPAAAIAALVVFWNWDWLIPIVQGRASSTLGRQVTIAHLQVYLGRVTTVDADDVRIANPPGFPENGDFALRAFVDVDFAFTESRAAINVSSQLASTRLLARFSLLWS